MKKNTKATAPQRSLPPEPARVEEECPSLVAIPPGCADFLARVAHDLRSPLGVVAEVIPTMRNDLATHLSDEHQLLLKLAERGLRRLTLFVDRMRLLADLELSRLELARCPTRLGPIIQQGVDAIVASEPRRGITVLFEPDSTLPVVDVDSGKLTHVIIELVSNAMRYAHKTVKISVQTNGHEVKIVVEDDGDGISEEQRTNLFHRFVNRSSRAGLGIGLSLTHDLVRAHGGRLSVEKSSLPPTGSGAVGAKFVVSFMI